MKHIKPLILFLYFFLLTIPPLVQAQHQHEMSSDEKNKLLWRMPMGNMTMPMLPGMGSYRPPMMPFLPLYGVDPTTLPLAQPKQVYQLNDGDTLMLVAKPVQRTI